MSHLVLARKSRPQTFAEVVGQKAVVKTLQNSIVRGRIAHAILFSGVRGVGKTTLARIMAKAINCTAEGGEIGAKPCNACSSCKDIARGQALDVIEIDGASNNGVDDVRNLKEIVQAQPAAAKYKIVIIDEVHMLSTSAFNALLKILEEPPKHACFMFATTEIHKIPVTILSRCQQYELKKVSAQELHRHFTKLAAEEGFAVEEAAISLIVREAGGSVRDGLSLLEQLLSFAEDTITLADVTDVLGLVGRDTLQRIAAALLHGDRSAAFDGLNSVFQFGLDRKRFLEDLLTTFRNLFFCAVSCSQLVDAADEERIELEAIARTVSAESIHLKLSLLMDAAEQVQRAAHPQFVLETTFMKIIEAGNVVPLAAVLGKMEEILPQIGTLSQSAVQAGGESAQQNVVPSPAISAGQFSSTASLSPVDRRGSKEEAAKGSIEKKKTAPRTAGSVGVEKTAEAKAVKKSEAEKEGTECSSPTRKKSREGECDKEEKEEAQQTVPPTPLSSLSKGEVERRWPDFIRYTEKERVGLAPVLRSISGLDYSAEPPQPPVIHLYYDSREETLLLKQDNNFNELCQLALDFFGEQVTLQLHQPEKEEDDENSPRALRNKLAQEPLVRMVEDIFHGKVSAVRLNSEHTTNNINHKR